MKTIYLALGCISITCSAQTTQISNQYGQPIGTAVTTGSTTIYSNQYGQPIATTITQPIAMPMATLSIAQPLNLLPLLQMSPMLGNK